MKIKTSVAMCTFNGEQFLKEQIDSILNQSVSIDEIIVCDDGSTDLTISILEEYSKKNPNLFKIYKNEINLKSVKNFEKGISLCSGEIIFLSDQDDIWELNKVEKMIHYFDQNPNIDVLATNGFCIDDNSKVHEKYAIWDVPQFLRDKNIEFDYFSLIAFVTNISTGASMAFRKSILKEIMPFPKIKDFHHDEWIAMYAAKKESFELLNGKYFYYRIHKNQQVGSVFYKKADSIKKYLIDFSDYKSVNSSFNVYKKRLKKNASFYDLNKKLIAQNIFLRNNFEENLALSFQFYTDTKQKMNQKYPIRAFFLNISDSIFNKRKINL
jgi:glycosyltransferase involved in cell wall biosynthesis